MALHPVAGASVVVVVVVTVVATVALFVGEVGALSRSRHAVKVEKCELPPSLNVMNRIT